MSHARQPRYRLRRWAECLGGAREGQSAVVVFPASWRFSESTYRGVMRSSGGGETEDGKPAAMRGGLWCWRG